MLQSGRDVAQHKYNVATTSQLQCYLRDVVTTLWQQCEITLLKMDLFGMRLVAEPFVEK